MFKAALVSALLYCASSQDFLNQANDVAVAAAPSNQDVQGLLNQVAAAAAPYANSVYRDNLGLSITIGEYEWVLTENGEGEVDLSVAGVAGDASAVSGQIAGLLGAAGVSLQNNVDAVNQAGAAQVQDAGIVLTDNNAVGQAASDYGAQLQSNADSLSPALADAYQGAGAQLAANQDGAADQVNQQLNAALANGVNAQDAQATIGQILGNLPADTLQGLGDAASQTGNDAQNAAAGVAASVDPVQSAAALESVASLNVNDATDAVNGAVNSGVAQAADVAGVDAVNVDVSAATNAASDAAAVNADASNAVNDAVSNALGGGR